ncbi:MULTISPECIES: hypothetical protein [unclassified Yoonia]|uniref:hypothetical protein n=1 Tax=unclassified Yoonia TaxID=2629118 RepID=UPI002AFE96FA|nr:MULTISPECIES: hypothetical protein [unclassified Yoonia]
MIEQFLNVLFKLLSLRSAVLVAILLGAAIAIPIAIWQVTYFQIETVGEVRAMLITSYVVGQVIAIIVLWLKRRVAAVFLRRSGRPDSKSPWRQDENE